MNDPAALPNQARERASKDWMSFEDWPPSRSCSSTCASCRGWMVRAVGRPRFVVGRPGARVAEPPDAILKWGAFHPADVFILPSHQENFGIAVAEALACGVPVLLSNKVNIWREVVGDEAGLAEPDGDAGTRRLLERWMTLDDDTRNRMRENAGQCFQRFDAPRVATQIAQCLEPLI